MTLTTQKKAQLRDFYYDTLGGGKIGKVWPRVQREFPNQYTRKQVQDFINLFFLTLVLYYTSINILFLEVSMRF